MRVIAGKAKGLKLKAPKQQWRVRPLTDQARAALFNILAERIPQARFLDLFAGTGAVGIEALSRGAERAVFVELNRAVAGLLKENLALTGFADQAAVLVMDAASGVGVLENQGEKFDLVYLGAPYDSPELEKVLNKLAATNILQEKAVVVAEHRRQHGLTEAYGRLKLRREARYGETILAFYQEEA